VSAVIATSGIDYNIKLWEPLADELCTLHDLDEVCVCVWVGVCVVCVCVCVCVCVHA